MVFVFITNSHFRFMIFDKDGNIINMTTLTLNNAAINKKTHCSLQGSHEAPYVSTLDEHCNIKKQALVLDNIQSSLEAKCEEHNELPPPQVQIVEPSYKERKLHTKEQIAGAYFQGMEAAQKRILVTSPLNTNTTFHEPPLNSTSTNEHQLAATHNTNSQKI